jgi:hypothetical protein
MQVTMDVQFPDFLAELVIVVQENVSGSHSTSTTTYILNGEQLTPDEVSTSINLPFAPRPKNQKGLVGPFL